MEPEPAEVAASAAQRVMLRALREYEQAGSAEERARLLKHLEQDLTAEEKDAACTRLETWLMGLPSPELEATPEYARYTALLPAMMAGTLDPGGEEYAEFVSFVAEWDTCLEEYHDLQETLEAGYRDWGEEAPPPEFGSADLSFLRSP